MNFRAGSDGTEVHLDTLCFLSLNVINDKVFLLLWWWFVILIGVGFMRSAFRMLQV